MITKVTQIPKISSEKLRLKDYNVLEWFEVYLYNTGCLIKSGLRHADGETKSPFYYEKSFWGKNWHKNAVKDFNEFLKNKGL
jgi:hypothetical protein